MSGQPKSGKIRAEVSHDLCTGSGRCVHVAPKGFRFNDERLAVFDANGECSALEVREAADACPMGAIAVIDDD
jgi:ferredoxin